MNTKEWKYKGYYIIKAGEQFKIYSHFYMWYCHGIFNSLKEAKNAIDSKNIAW